MKKLDYAKYFPPGMDWEKEIRQFCIALGLAVIIGCYLSLRNFFYEIKIAEAYLENGETLENVRLFGMVPQFIDMIEPSMVCFLLVILIFIAKIFLYGKSFSQGAKSIYTMKRLPQKNEIYRRILVAPFSAMGISLFVFAILLLIYFSIYRNIIPAEWL